MGVVVVLWLGDVGFDGESEERGDGPCQLLCLGVGGLGVRGRGGGEGFGGAADARCCGLGVVAFPLAAGADVVDQQLRMSGEQFPPRGDLAVLVARHTALAG
ncbi:hypothetical protein GCM10009864_60130 [Streptomyces lunalinharesii]|uniref:Secreted protein n=1 Tax=Streptomyces lunalinharesii TaxID=333384 RepID=A0ABP6EZA0_9ACTN